MANLWIIEYLAKGVSRAMLLWWFAGQNSDTNSGLWICNRGNKPMIAFQQAPNRQKDPPETYYLFVWAGWQILKTQQSISVLSRRALARKFKIEYLTHTQTTQDNRLYMHSTLPMHANQFVASPELEGSDSSTHSIPVLYQIWALPSVQILIPFWMIALPAWPQDMVHIAF